MSTAFCQVLESALVQTNSAPVLTAGAIWWRRSRRRRSCLRRRRSRPVAGVLGRIRQVVLVRDFGRGRRRSIRRPASRPPSCRMDPGRRRRRRPPVEREPSLAVWFGEPTTTNDPLVATDQPGCRARSDRPPGGTGALHEQVDAQRVARHGRRRRSAMSVRAARGAPAGGGRSRRSPAAGCSAGSSSRGGASPSHPRDGRWCCRQSDRAQPCWCWIACEEHERYRRPARRRAGR